METSRPKWQNWVLWVIPIVTWIALTVVLWPSDNPPKSVLLKSEDQVLLNEVENYLLRQGIAYSREEENRIVVNSDQHQWITNQLRARDLIGFKTQPTQEP